MAEPHNGLEQRVAELEIQVANLTAMVNQLQQVQNDESAVGTLEKKKASDRLAAGGGPSEEFLSLIDKSLILPRVATTSFVLFVAVALRTASDSGTIDLQIGSFAGLVYALGLLLYGWLAYRRQSIQAPVFAFWGTFIMCSVVVETHRVFATVPAELAYVAVAVTGLVGTLISRTSHVAFPVFVGTLGMSFGAFAIDYPSPVFPYLVIIMALANCFAAYANRLVSASWLRWVLLLLTLFMVQIWLLKIGIYLGRQTPDQLEFSMQGILPSIGSLGVMFAVLSLLGVLGKIREKVSRFDLALPVVNVCWLYLAVTAALNHGVGSGAVFGWCAVVAAVAQLALAWWLAHRSAEGVGSTSFALAGGLLFAYAAPLAIGHAVVASAMVALLAVAMAWVSVKQELLGLRLAGYLLQFYACLSLVSLLWSTDRSEPSIVGALSSALLATIAFIHYFWSRRHPPVEGDSLLSRINKNDRGGAVLLVAALVSGFFTLRVGLFQGLVVLGAATTSAFNGAQSVLLNGMALVLLWLSLSRRNTELRTVAILLTVVGAIKVFMMDMVTLKGMPLMVSVFTFGLVAAFASFVLGRWNKPVGREMKSQE